MVDDLGCVTKEGLSKSNGVTINHYEKFMSARMEVESRNWKNLESVSGEHPGQEVLDVQLESFLRNADETSLVAPLREAQANLASAQRPRAGAQAERRAALVLQQQWNAWLDERDVLINEIKRGNECLAQIQEELGDMRVRLEEWAAYERHCGKNPLFDFMQSIATKERLERFLPRWLARREAQLHRLNQDIELCARQHGLACSG